MIKGKIFSKEKLDKSKMYLWGKYGSRYLCTIGGVDEKDIVMMAISSNEHKISIINRNVIFLTINPSGLPRFLKECATLDKDYLSASLTIEG